MREFLDKNPQQSKKMSNVITAQPKQEMSDIDNDPLCEVITIRPESNDISRSIKSNQIDDKLFAYLGRLNSIIIRQGQEIFEETTAVASLGCCKVETENNYALINPDTKETMLTATEVLKNTKYSNPIVYGGETVGNVWLFLVGFKTVKKVSLQLSDSMNVANLISPFKLCCLLTAQKHILTLITQLVFSMQFSEYKLF